MQAELREGPDGARPGPELLLGLLEDSVHRRDAISFSLYKDHSGVQ